MRTVKKWLGHYSEFGLGVGFALSFVICLRMLMHGMVTNSLWVTLFGIVLFALLFLLTFLRYRYSVIEKNMDRDFQSIEIDDVQKKFFEYVRYNGNLLIFSTSQNTEDIPETEIYNIARKVGVQKEKLVAILKSQQGEEEEYKILNPDQLSSSQYAKRVSKFYVATLSPDRGRYSIEDLFIKQRKNKTENTSRL